MCGAVGRDVGGSEEANHLISDVNVRVVCGHGPELSSSERAARGIQKTLPGFMLACNGCAVDGKMGEQSHNAYGTISNNIRVLSHFS